MAKLLLRKEHIFYLKDHSYKNLERAKGVEPSTFSLATRRSTTELCPHLNLLDIIKLFNFYKIRKPYFLDKIHQNIYFLCQECVIQIFNYMT